MDQMCSSCLREDETHDRVERLLGVVNRDLETYDLNFG